MARSTGLRLEIKYITNADHVTAYTTYDSPTKNAIFNPGKTSRINVADFMAQLLVSHEEWNKWEGKMPVVYNAVDH